MGWSAYERGFSTGQSPTENTKPEEAELLPARRRILHPPNLLVGWRHGGVRRSRAVDRLLDLLGLVLHVLEFLRREPAIGLVGGDAGLQLAHVVFQVLS